MKREFWLLLLLAALASSATAQSLQQVKKQAARNWQFNPPSTGDRVDDNFWVVIVPIDYIISAGPTSPDTRGTWTQYVPGPLQTGPDWRRSQDDLAASDALVAGQIQMAGSGRRLLSSLDSEPAP